MQNRAWVHATSDLPVFCASGVFQIIVAACHKLVHGVTARHLTCTVTSEPSGSWALISFLADFFFPFFVPAIQQQQQILIKHGDSSVAWDACTDQRVFWVSVLSFRPAITNLLLRDVNFFPLLHFVAASFYFPGLKTKKYLTSVFRVYVGIL